MENGRDAEFGDEYPSDDDVDNWLSQVNDDIHDTLGRIVDTDANLLRLKQCMAKEAISIAHANGCEGSDRMIRSLLVAGSSSAESGVGIQRSTVSVARRAVMKAVLKSTETYLRGLPTYSLLVLGGSIFTVLVTTLAYGIRMVSTAGHDRPALTIWAAVLSFVGVGCILKTAVAISWKLRGPVGNLVLMERALMSFRVMRAVCHVRRSGLKDSDSLVTAVVGAVPGAPAVHTLARLADLPVQATDLVSYSRKNWLTVTADMNCCVHECGTVRRPAMERLPLDDRWRPPAVVAERAPKDRRASRRRRHMASTSLIAPQCPKRTQHLGRKTDD